MYQAISSSSNDFFIRQDKLGKRRYNLQYIQYKVYKVFFIEYTKFTIGKFNILSENYALNKHNRQNKISWKPVLIQGCLKPYNCSFTTSITLIIKGSRSRELPLFIPHFHYTRTVQFIAGFPKELTLPAAQTNEACQRLYGCSGGQCVGKLSVKNHIQLSL